ncbi:hypothetical protein LXA43DRAFT_1132426 [Ganoderma leucocontextum]|nr:hypothetical protein LXA43DRAFT_1132426 [Ganoderma leucocontextum]
MVFQAWKLSGHATEHGLVSEWVRATWVCKTWREVALDTAVLWSSVLVSRRLADDPVLEMQLDRAHGVALDLLVSCPQMYSAEVEEALSLVVSKRKIIKKLKIIYTEWEQRDVVEAFVKDVGAEVVSLSLLPAANRSREWEFTPDIFPRLRHLTLDKIIPISRTPLLNLTQLEMAYAYDDQDEWASVILTRCTYVHKFLAACPNLETLRMDDCFLFPPHYNEQEQPVVALPKLRYLSVADFAFDISEGLRTLRLPPSSSFHITTDCDGDADIDFTILIIPPNVSESLPPIRRTRCLSLMVGQRPPSHLSLRGGPGDNFGDESNWSITIPDLECSFERSRTWASRFPDWEMAKLYYLGYNRQRFLSQIPRLVVPSRLVQLQLHIALGLPVARDWARFFATMPRLRTLGIGGGALIAHALQAFEADPSLCPDLEDLELCATVGWPVDDGVLAEFIPRVIGAWVRQRTRVGMGPGLSSLTVRTPAGGSGARAGLGGGQEHDADLVGFASKLRQDLALLKGSVGEVLV